MREHAGTGEIRNDAVMRKEYGYSMEKKYEVK